eukprot:Tbor_TRINITY_DN646_c0_g1::TRINITY_DN646_c0_g1_i1::g.1531::m.1531/K17279/REEP5_6; receptor expression-enhancing protein 5/6
MLSSLSPVEFFLQSCLWYVSFVHPIYIGAKLCSAQDTREKDIKNCTISFAFIWLIELADQLILSDLIAMKNFYLFMRIILCLYILHPQFCGALRLYERCGIKTLIETHGEMIDTHITNNLNLFSHQGAVKYGQETLQNILLIAKSAISVGFKLLIPSEERGNKMDKVD